MQFRIGKISAKCSSCGSTQFKPDPEDHSGPLARFYCAVCDTATQYSELDGATFGISAPRSKEGRGPQRKRAYSKGGTVRR